MQKVRIYRGIEYIRLSQLPVEESDKIKSWLQADMIIKIQTEEELMSDCVEYKNYVYWFEHIRSKIPSTEAAPEAKKANPKQKPYTGLAFE